MTWFWQRKSDKQAECDASPTLRLPPETSSNPVLIRCMYKQLMCHSFNKQRFVFYELISPKVTQILLTCQRARDAKNGWVPHAMDRFPSASPRHSPADSHCLKSSGWGTRCQTPSITTSQKSSKCPGCCRLSSPFLYEHPFKPQTRRQASCHHWSVMLCILQWEACGKPWMFDQNCILLMKSSISQLEAANTPNSPQVPSSYLPSTSLCILILCMSKGGLPMIAPDVLQAVRIASSKILHSPLLSAFL